MTDLALNAYGELWVSLASLLRSYTAAHGLNGNRQATVELAEERITVRHGDNWLDLRRHGSQVNWQRENGQSGVLELTDDGQLRSIGCAEREELELDMAAEKWARELMR